MVAVTVLLPVYNGEEYLEETISSILGQSFADYEFLIVDDGSSDKSPDIISGFSDPRIRVLKNPARLKLSGALNRGMREAKGRFIARMDADDIALPERLEKQVEYLERHSEIGICGTAIEIFGDGRQRVETYPSSTEDIRCYTLFDCPFCHPSVMMRKSFLDKHALEYDGSYYPTEDYELWARAVECFPVANLQEKLLKYRVHESSMTGSDWSMMDKKATEIVDGILQCFGMPYSNDDLVFHRHIGRGRSVQLTKFEDLSRAHAWLGKLAEVNLKAGHYEQASLTDTLALVWYRLCMNNVSYGMRMYRHYISSSLARKDKRLRQRGTILLLSVLKNRIVKMAGNS